VLGVGKLNILEVSAADLLFFATCLLSMTISMLQVCSGNVNIFESSAVLSLQFPRPDPPPKKEIQIGQQGENTQLNLISPEKSADRCTFLFAFLNNLSVSCAVARVCLFNKALNAIGQSLDLPLTRYLESLQDRKR